MMTSMIATTDTHDGNLESRADGEQLSWALVDEFSSSMPQSYRVLFDPRAIRQHCGIVSRRGQQVAHVEIWRLLPDRSAAICVVADDRPGLLSAIAAALVSHGLDVITALAFSRTDRAMGRADAVDLLWVRRANPADTAALGAAEAASIVTVLSALLEGRIAVEDIAACTVAPNPYPSAVTSVRFDDTDEDGRAVLIVEAPDRTGMLLTIALEVFLQGAQIARSLIRTVGQRAYNRFQLVERDGRSLSFQRREQIRSAVYSALTSRPAANP
jgi:[protein-PII] uridylyltransferase